MRFKECFLTEKYLAIAMEYAAGGDMYRYVIEKCARAADKPCAECPLYPLHHSLAGTERGGSVGRTARHVL